MKLVYKIIIYFPCLLKRWFVFVCCVNNWKITLLQKFDNKLQLTWINLLRTFILLGAPNHHYSETTTARDIWIKSVRVWGWLFALRGTYSRFNVYHRVWGPVNTMILWRIWPKLVQMFFQGAMFSFCIFRALWY